MAEKTEDLKHKTDKPVEAKKDVKQEAKPAEARKDTKQVSAPAPVDQKPKGKSNVMVGDAHPSQVVKVFKKVGLYGECYQVLVRVLDGPDKGNLLRRNVRGPVKENDLLMLKETERDVRAI